MIALVKFFKYGTVSTNIFKYFKVTAVTFTPLVILNISILKIKDEKRKKQHITEDDLDSEDGRGQKCYTATPYDNGRIRRNQYNIVLINLQIY